MLNEEIQLVAQQNAPIWVLSRPVSITNFELDRNALECTYINVDFPIFSIKEQYQNAPECTKMNIEFQKFPGGDTPGPPITVETQPVRRWRTIYHPPALIQILAALHCSAFFESPGCQTGQAYSSINRIR